MRGSVLLVFAAVALVVLQPSSILAQPLADDGADVVRYDGRVIAHVDATTPDDLARLEALGAELVSCELSPAGGDFMVPASLLGAVEGLGFRASVTHPDVQGAVDAESVRIRASLERYRQRGGDADFFDDFRPLTEVDAFLDELVARRPDLASRFEIGTSIEGRPIWGIRITSPSEGCKPAFALNGITHAREWLTVMNVLYLAEQLIDGYGVDEEITDAVDRVEWLIVPVLNPDGYEYSWTTNRFWRHNRRPGGGVDLNRNYSVFFSPGGTHGPSPFSEPETAALRDMVLGNARVRAHNDTHSYSDLVLFPWAYLTQPCPDSKEYQALGDAMVDRIDEANDGHSGWVAGPGSTTLYRIQGGSFDWFYVEAKAMSFLYELRGGRFNPPPSQILPGSRDTFRATLTHALYVADRPVYRADLDQNCELDIDDVLAFLVAFGDGQTVADFDVDGDVDFDDVVAFLVAFDERS